MTDISLDELMSGDGNAMPETTDIQQTELQPADTGQQRDEHGRFAPKAETPAIVEPEQPGAIETHAEPGKGVPVGAVQAEREKRQAAQHEAETLRRELAELRGQVTLLTTQRQQPAPQAPQEAKPPASIWEDPDNFIQSQLSPVQQELQQTRNMLLQMQASQQYGADKVQAALEAAKALEGTPQETALEAQIMGGGNPFGNLVQWHERQQTLATVGNDPQAWLQAEVAKLKADPAFQAEIIALARGGVVQNGNRSQQPVTSIPPSLGRIPTGGNQADDNDMSDGALFAHATR